MSPLDCFLMAPSPTAAPAGVLLLPKAPSATYDAFMRMQTGQETRTIAHKINDPNRVSWEQFRKVRLGPDRDFAYVHVVFWLRSHT